ncbi:hypothetical protein EGW08_013533 [Elysia chlorotica]|uniref:Protein CUSTOS n=1 Tax=Elysia chlorotica TaxID=188477 RepID=A0A3S0ZZ09_ELYCH|nr:hypothetical protein EGW08_013533 [Elysia chlorotica]
MIKSKGNASPSSSSESSDEDDEEQQRIREAVLGVGTSAYQKTEAGSNVQMAEQTSTQQKTLTFSFKTPLSVGKSILDISKLKSNRPQDRNEEDHEPLLKTTPEFRAYVAKQLSKLLDGDLSECVFESVWEKNVRDNRKYDGGVKLFSDSQTLCKLNSCETRKPETLPEPRKRKIRVSTSSSSDSSEDEDIKACVFSVADIEQENQRLAALEGKPTNQTSGNQGSEAGDLQAPDTSRKLDETHPSSKKSENGAKESKKKKKKKKKKKNDEKVTV